ncbi:MAG: thioredoxin family protein [Planctomycetota bacterium]
MNCRIAALAALFVLVGSSARSAETVTEECPNAKLFRHRTYQDAWRASQKSNRPVLIYVSMPQCAHCVRMLEQTYGSGEVTQLVDDSFETVSVDRYRDAELVGKLHIKWYPTTILVGTNNKVLAKLEGYIEPQQFKRKIKTNLAVQTAATATR